MPQFAKSLFVAYATRNKRMPDFKCAIIALINKKKTKKNNEHPVFETRGTCLWKKIYELLPALHSCSRDWINRVIELSTQKFAGASRITLMKCAWNNFDVHFKMRRICSIINTANGLCSLQRQIFEIIKTCFNILQLQSGNTLPHLRRCVTVEGRQAEMRTDALVSQTLIMTFRAVFIADCQWYYRLRWVDKKIPALPAAGYQPWKLFLRRSFNITQQRKFTFYSDISLT